MAGELPNVGHYNDQIEEAAFAIRQVTKTYQPTSDAFFAQTECIIHDLVRDIILEVNQHFINENLTAAHESSEMLLKAVLAGVFNVGKEEH